MFIQAKKKRDVLRLPILHYIVADDWMDKLGPKAFTAWLKFHTWVNRKDEEIDDISKAKIPMSLEKVAKKLDISISTLRRILVPLWEFGLIDLIEFEGSVRNTTKPINIIPYDYPQNNKELETKPLEKCRDWKKDYNTKAKFFGLRGGRPKVEVKEEHSKIITEEKKVLEFYSKKEEAAGQTIELEVEEWAPFEDVEQTVEMEEADDPFEEAEQKTNKHGLLMDEEGILNIKTKLYKFLVAQKIDPVVANEIVTLSQEKGVFMYEYEVVEQLRNMFYKIKIEGEDITNFPVYFVNGIVMQRQQRKTKKQLRDLERIREERLKQYAKQHQIRTPIIHFNWLEEDTN